MYTLAFKTMSGIVFDPQEEQDIFISITGAKNVELYVIAQLCTLDDW